MPSSDWVQRASWAPELARPMPQLEVKPCTFPPANVITSGSKQLTSASSTALLSASHRGRFTRRTDPGTDRSRDDTSADRPSPKRIHTEETTSRRQHGRTEPVRDSPRGRDTPTSDCGCPRVRASFASTTTTLPRKEKKKKKKDSCVPLLHAECAKRP